MISTSIAVLLSLSSLYCKIKGNLKSYALKVLCDKIVIK